mmetsp:Transcript_29712/g.48324  ORF Transcript_29712/g.48324 Transcript_29712/m.48324 type:complete len:181 (-) Transcript_29712:113-655(-)
MANPCIILIAIFLFICHHEVQAKFSVSFSRNQLHFPLKKDDKPAGLLATPTSARPANSRHDIWSTMARGGAGGKVTQIATQRELDDIIAEAGDKLIVIDFTAVWCGPCQMIAPAYEQFSEEYDNVIFLKCDVDENKETTTKFGVTAMPTFIFLRRGEQVNSFSGASAARLKQAIDGAMTI